MQFIKSLNLCRLAQLILYKTPFYKSENGIFSLAVVFFQTKIQIKCLSMVTPAVAQSYVSLKTSIKKSRRPLTKRSIKYKLV